MKHLYTQILAAVCCISSFSTYGQHTDGFWGIPFRGSMAQALKITTAKGLNPIHKTEDNLAFNNVSFAGVNADFVTLGFYDNKLYGGMAKFKYVSSVLVLDNYNVWKKKLIQKYGEPTVVTEELPSYLKDTKENILLEHAIKNGEAKFICIWRATDNATGEMSAVTLKVSDETAIVIALSDIALTKQMGEVDEKANSKDY